MNRSDLSKCKFAADIVPYMYGELLTSASSAFESHLLDCEDCTDEFAAISNARFEVYEWKKLDFDPLATPRFAIPYDEVPQATFVDKVRAVFASSWAIPTVGFASLALIAIFAASLILSDRGADDVAKNTAVPPVTVSNTTREPAQVQSVAKDENLAEATTATEVRHTPPHRTELRRAVRDNRPARMIEARATKIDRPVQTAPTLNEFADDEDNSLRLAELFDDIETLE